MGLGRLTDLDLEVLQTDSLVHREASVNLEKEVKE